MADTPHLRSRERVFLADGPSDLIITWRANDGRGRKMESEDGCPGSAVKRKPSTNRNERRKMENRKEALKGIKEDIGYRPGFR